MRKITRDACTAFRGGYSYRNANTHVTQNTQGGASRGDMQMTLHGNRIAYTVGGALYVTTCGWNTNTTRERLNGLDGVHVTTKNGQAYLNGYKWNGDIVHVQGFTGNVSDSDTEKRNALKKSIAEYSKLYTYPYPQPSAGDCWYCSLCDQNGKTLDTLTGDHAHLAQHVQEKYVHGSLLYHALKEYGCIDMHMGVWFHIDSMQEQVQRAIRKYLQRKLIP